MEPNELIGRPGRNGRALLSLNEQAAAAQRASCTGATDRAAAPASVVADFLVGAHALP